MRWTSCVAANVSVFLYQNKILQTYFPQNLSHANYDWIIRLRRPFDKGLMPGFGLKSINFSKTTPSLPAKVLDQPVGRAAEEPRYHDRLEFLRALPNVEKIKLHWQFAHIPKCSLRSSSPTRNGGYTETPLSSFVSTDCAPQPPLSWHGRAQ